MLVNINALASIAAIQLYADVADGQQREEQRRAKQKQENTRTRRWEETRRTETDGWTCNTQASEDEREKVGK